VNKVRLRDAPHPLRELLVVYILAVLTTTVITLFTEGTILRIATVTLGASALLFGLTLLTNLKGGADYYSRLPARRSWLGVDYSRSVLARPVVMRLGGALFAVVGVVFIVNGVTGPV
jgi:hypothetical protein